MSEVIASHSEIQRSILTARHQTS